MPGREIIRRDSKDLIRWWLEPYPDVPPRVVNFFFSCRGPRPPPAAPFPHLSALDTVPTSRFVRCGFVESVGRRIRLAG